MEPYRFEPEAPEDYQEPDEEDGEDGEDGEDCEDGEDRLTMAILEARSENQITIDM